MATRMIAWRPNKPLRLLRLLLQRLIVLGLLWGSATGYAIGEVDILREATGQPGAWTLWQSDGDQEAFRVEASGLLDADGDGSVPDAPIVWTLTLDGESAPFVAHENGRYISFDIPLDKHGKIEIVATATNANDSSDSATDTDTVTIDTWLVGEAISGVGEIQRVDQDVNTNFLHYGGTGTPETAKFKINLESAVDKDKRYSNGEIKDAGLHAADTTWRVKAAAAGVIVDGGVATTFTPGNTVHSNINVFATVSEGHSYSYEYGNNDKPVEVKWNETLTTFKVGIKLDPGNHKLWEDDAAASKTVAFKSASLSCKIGWSGLWYEGIKKKGNEYPTKNLKWRAIAASSSGNVGGIQGSIKFTPAITAVGKYRMFGDLAGLQYPGFAGEIVATLAGFVNPYVGAAVSLALKGMSSSKTEWIGKIAGETVIENDKKKTIDKESNSSSSTTTVDLAGLSINGKTLTVDKDDETRGSINIKSMVVVNDNGIANRAHMKIDNYINGTLYTAAPHAKASFSSTRPIYVAPSD